MNLPPIVRWAIGIRWQWKVFIPIIAVLLLSIVAIASVLETSPPDAPAESARSAASISGSSAQQSATIPRRPPVTRPVMARGPTQNAAPRNKTALRSTNRAAKTLPESSADKSPTGPAERARPTSSWVGGQGLERVR